MKKTRVYCTHDLQGEVEALRDLCRRQEKEMEALCVHKDKLQYQLTDSQNMVHDLRVRINFLEGQIEAYQYCMNCRK